jgi:hypothetical protein
VCLVLEQKIPLEPGGEKKEGYHCTPSRVETETWREHGGENARSAIVVVETRGCPLGDTGVGAVDSLTGILQHIYNRTRHINHKTGHSLQASHQQKNTKKNAKTMDFTNGFQYTPGGSTN